MRRPSWHLVIATSLMAAFLAGCSGGSSSLSSDADSNSTPGAGGGGGAGTGGGGGGTPVAPSSRFDLAHGCFVLLANRSYVVRDGNNFAATGNRAERAQRFYMQPANLGRYVFYTDDQQIMTGNGSTVSATATPADGSDWTIDGTDGRYNATALGTALSVDGSDNLALGGLAAVLEFEPASGCEPYPEMPTGITANSYTGPAAGQPVIGFAEIHAHMGQASEMSDGSGDVGPSAGGVLWGQPINRFGVPVALGNCEEMHGEDGRLSAENIVLDGDPAASHDTQGWPTFVDWPFHDSFLHQQMYWKWVERAWKAGLRIMVVHGTGIEALCNIGKASYGDPNADCRDMGNGEDQVRYMYDVQDYVDAQYGGPGKGWFRVVLSPQEAREVIAEGKLAVMLGYEFPNIWFCRVTFNPNGSENRECDEASVDAEIDRAWDLGIRNVFPYHDVDSSLGGTGIFSSVLNYVGFSDTRGFWKTYDCPDGGVGPTYFYNAGAEMEAAPPNPALDDAITAITSVTGGTVPVYPSGRQCNARTVTDLGAYAINKMMKKGFVIHIDHAELLSKQYLLDEGAKTTPNYPHPSGHGAQGGLTTAQAEQLIRQGGIIYPALPNGAGWAAFKDRLEAVWTASGTSRPIAIGYGADANGLRTLPGPRGASSDPVLYPFTLFSGPDWGPQFAAAGIQPLQVDMLSIPGGRAWDINQDGMYHFGMVPDIVEEIRIEAGRDGLDTFYRSAEAYLQMWEQVQAASADARARNLPVPTVLPTPP